MLTRCACILFEHVPLFMYLMTRSALSAAVLAVSRVEQIKGMAARAVGLSAVLGFWRHAAEYVRFERDWLQMRWVYTIANPAQVVNGKPFRDRSNQQLVSESVCRLFLPVNPQQSVPVGFRCLPKPARSGYVNLGPKALLGRASLVGVHRIASSPFTVVVKAAHRFCKVLLAAASDLAQPHLNYSLPYFRDRVKHGPGVR